MNRRTFLAGLAALPLLPQAALARTTAIFSTNGIAIHGYDPVAYFTQSKPVEGSPAHALIWHGAKLLFASAEHQAMFEAAPEIYVPQYGGYCAYAMSKGAIATTVPEAWTVHDNRLYLNFSTGVRSLWSEDIPGNIARANSYWPAILDG